MRHISQGILTDQVQFGTVGYGEGSSGLAYSHSGAHKMPSFSVSISLPCNFHFFPGYTYLHKHTHKQHTARRFPRLATQKHSTFHVPTSPRFGFAREHMHFGFSLLVHSHLHGSFHFLASFHKYLSRELGHSHARY